MKVMQFHSRYALSIIVAISCYQLLLCFLNTHGIIVTNALVSVTEILILTATAVKVIPKRRVEELAGLALLIGIFLFLWAFRGEIDLFGPRNIVVIMLFLWLGQSLHSKDDANKIIWIISGIVLFFGFMEYFLTDTYLKTFDILHYYINRGQTSEAQTTYLQNNLFVSGMRPSGRNILPFLGDQRVSSIFLEPVSMGNYAIIVAMWALSYDFKEWKKSWGHFLTSALLIIACDSRFASMVIVLLILVRVIPLAQKKSLLVVMPIPILMGLVYFASNRLANGENDDLPGRIMRTGEALLNIDLLHFLGLSAPENFFDMGIPYSLETFGVVLSILLWLGLCSLHATEAAGVRFKAMIAVYCLGLLMISGTSFYSSKTAAILWLMMGALQKNIKTYQPTPPLDPHFQIAMTAEN